MSEGDGSPLAHGPLLIGTWVALQTGALGFRLLFAARPPAWSEAVVGAPLGELPEGTTTLVLALMRVAGVGLFLAGAAMGVIAIGPGFRGAPWARWTPPAMGVVLYATLLVVLLGLHNTTGADTPWLPAAVSAGASAVGMLLAAATPALRTM